MKSPVNSSYRHFNFLSCSLSRLISATRGSLRAGPPTRHQAVARKTVGERIYYRQTGFPVVDLRRGCINRPWS